MMLEVFQGLDIIYHLDNANISEYYNKGILFSVKNKSIQKWK